MNKNRQADLEIVYLHFAKPLYFYLLKLTGSSHIAEELVQETFYRATLSLDLYEEGQVKSWLFKVARNAYMDEWRKRKRWNWVPFYDALSNSSKLVSPYGVPDTVLSSKEMRREVSHVMEMLPENYRSILYLREYGQFTYEELGETLDLSAEQVKVTLYRARKRFKQLAEKVGTTWKEV